MDYGEPTSQRELTEAKAYSRSRIAMERAEARRKAGLPSEREATRRTVAPQQSGGYDACRLIGAPYNPDDERFARLLDSIFRAGRTAGWNDCFRKYEKEINRA